MFPWILIEGKSEMRAYTCLSSVTQTVHRCICDSAALHVCLLYVSIAPNQFSVAATFVLLSFHVCLICLLNKICVLFELFQLPPVLAENESDNLELDIKEQLWTI